MALAEIRRRTQRFSEGTQKRCSCRFTSNRRFVLLLAWETRFPDMARFSVTGHTGITFSVYRIAAQCARRVFERGAQHKSGDTGNILMKSPESLRIATQALEFGHFLPVMAALAVPTHR